MRPAYVWQLARKEILSTLRDRRAIVSNLLIPLLLLPVMMLGLPLLIGGLFQREQVAVTQVAVSGEAELPPELAEQLLAQSTELVPTADPEAAVLAGDQPVGIAVPAGFAERVGTGERVELTVYAKRGNTRSELAAGKIGAAVNAYRQQLVAERLAGAGLDPAILEPVTIQTVDASTSRERSSGQLSWLIPFFIAIWTLAGGQMTAIDATAGEKERGTLESLLVAPVRRSEVVVGKWLATMTFGLTAAVMAIVGFVLGGALLRGAVLPQLGLGGDAGEIVEVMGGSLQTGPGGVLLLLVSALLLSGLIAALLLGVALFARSFKEAQSYVAPLSFIMIIPALALQFNDLIGFGSGAYLVPIMNVLLVMDGIVKGTASAPEVLMTWVSQLVAIALLLLFAYRSFTRESVIFRT